MNNREQWTKLFLVILMLIGLLAVALASTGNLKKMGKYKEATLVSSYGEMFVDAVMGSEKQLVEEKVVKTNNLSEEDKKAIAFYAQFEKDRKLKAAKILEAKLKLAENELKKRSVKKADGKVFIDKEGNVFQIVPMASVVKKETNSSDIVAVASEQKLNKKAK